MAVLQCALPWTQVPLLPGSVPKTVAAIQAGSGQVVKILEILCSLDGAIGTNSPVLTDVARPIGGTATAITGTTWNQYKKDPERMESVRATGYITFTQEPSPINPIWSFYLAQYMGLYHYIIPLGNPLIVPAGGAFGIRQTNPNTTGSVNSSGKIEFEE